MATRAIRAAMGELFAQPADGIIELTQVGSRLV